MLVLLTLVFKFSAPFLGDHVLLGLGIRQLLGVTHSACYRILIRDHLLDSLRLVAPRAPDQLVPLTVPGLLLPQAAVAPAGLALVLASVRPLDDGADRRAAPER